LQGLAAQMRREQAMQQQADVACGCGCIKILFGKVQKSMGSDSVDLSLSRSSVVMQP